VGIDDFAERFLRRSSRIQLPDVGHELKQGSTGFRVIKDNQTARVLSPVDGIVIHVNHKLMDHPELINESPYEEGWLFIVEPTKLSKNLKGLYYGEEAEKYMKDEREILFSMAHDDLKIAADGGVSEEDVFEELQEKNWKKVVKTFFRT
jgi:glycine cleavage system H protein